MAQPTVTLKWLKPIPLEELGSNVDFIVAGIYCILRKYGDKTTIFYVGKSDSQGTQKRLKDHQYTGKTDEKKGRKYVTCAAINSNNAKNLDHKILIDDVESALIYVSQPEDNKQKKNSFNYKKAVTIKNTGSYPKEFGATIDFVKLYELSKTNPIKPKKKNKSDEDDWGLGRVDFGFRL